MRIVICGASGFVGRQLVPLLLEQGAELLLVGRDVNRLAGEFPGAACCGYEDLVERAAGFDRLVYLAVLNNNATASREEFFAVNVEHLLRTAAAARQAGIRQFVNISSIHALDTGNKTPYAASKRAAVEALRSVDGIDVATLYLPLVYADLWSGSLSFLNRLPAGVAKAAFAMLKAFKPTIHVASLAKELASTELIDGKILSDGQAGNLTYRLASRSVDWAFAFVVLVPLGWLLLGLLLLVRLESPGKAIFAQTRVGREGRLFTLYKFRTMHTGMRQVPTHDARTNDVTRVGAPLRRFKLDELPQAWNVVRGEISLVGPRPCLPSQKELIEARGCRGVLKLRPGITGLAQINGIDMKDPELLAKWDQRYSALQCLMLDLRILWVTATGAGAGDKVGV